MINSKDCPELYKAKLNRFQKTAVQIARQADADTVKQNLQIGFGERIDPLEHLRESIPLIPGKVNPVMKLVDTEFSRD